MQAAMAENPRLCYICHQSRISKPSTDWCSECEQALCNECLKYHGFSRLSKYHKTVPVVDFLRLQETISTEGSYCIEHKEINQLFCQTHDCPICLTCVENHSECKDIIRMNKLTDNIKSSDLFKETRQDFIDIQKNIARFQDLLRTNLTDIQDQKEAILRDVTRSRQKINDHLDIIEQEIKDEVLECVSSTCDDINSTIRDLHDKSYKIQKNQQQLDKIIQYGSGLQAFLGLRKVRSDVTKLDYFVEDLVEGTNLDKIMLKFDTSESYATIKDLTLGSIEIEKIHSSIEVERSIHKIKINLLKKIDVLSDDIRGCCILPDGKMVFTDFSDNDCLIVVDTDGKTLFQMSTKPFYAFDVTPVDDSKVAVTTANKRRVNIVNIERQNIEKIIETENNCWGVSNDNQSLLCCVEGKGIQKIDLEENLKTKTIVPYESECLLYVESFGENIYCMKRDSDKITCHDTTGKNIWTFENETILKWSNGLTVDNFGNLYVTCKEFNSVVLVSPDGQQSRRLLSEEDGLDNPIALYFDRKRNHLLVSNDKKSAFLFEKL